MNCRPIAVFSSVNSRGKRDQIMLQMVSLLAGKMRGPYALAFIRVEDVLSSVSTPILISCILNVEEP